MVNDPQQSNIPETAGVHSSCEADCPLLESDLRCRQALVCGADMVPPFVVHSKQRKREIGWAEQLPWVCSWSKVGHSFI